MSGNYTRSIASAGSESVASVHLSSSARAERSASNPASFAIDHYDTALPPISFQNPALAHRRTGSTLKTVMRKIFNRKRQSAADGLEESPNEAFYTTPVRKPGPGKSFLSVPTPTESKRSSPLSEENLQLQFAESHLSPTSAKGGSLPSPGLPRRRRATLPSVIFSDDESRFAVASAISDPQEDRHAHDGRYSLLQNRRTRSTEALHHEDWPPRATSAASGPNSKSPALGSSVSDPSVRPSTGTTVTSVTRASVAPSISEADERADQMSLPPNMGNFVHSMQQDDGLTVEQRLNTLEVKMIDLEFAIARMQSSPIDGPTDRSRQKRTPSAEPIRTPTSHTRNKPSSGYLGSLDRERDRDRDESPSPLANFCAVRPSSTSTIRQDTLSNRSIRPAPSATSLSEYSGVSIEQYSTLVTLLRREQTARRNLESQVSSLRDDLRQIQRAALHSMEMGTMYPIQGVDSQEFLRFRRALDDSDSSPPISRDRDRANPDFEEASEYGRDDPIGPHKWDNSRTLTMPMI
ncbi:hypothetical protein N7520_008269 [Penicillium odoratum]|uniref:uncharacterized protein n=1 Tax=Penicillium odoratum TaxID=1167516 RepID=UPI00254819A2|nr:uncharacterized protein N7520_008269 [Penicillium odoratum]KAJ5761113.1 hypothetical protein N7520_008269 [Penicillium odoratum]